MRVAVIGTGNIGGTIGRALASNGHEVAFGSRTPEESTGVAGGTGAKVTDVASSLAGAEAVVLALPGPGVAGFLNEHAGALHGILVVDATNNMAGGGPAHAHDLVVGAVPEARYARAFNTLGWENFAEPRFGNEVADLFFSSSNADAPVVAELVEAVGLRPVHVGPDTQDVVDGLLRLWFALSQAHGRHLAFKMLVGPA